MNSVKNKLRERRNAAVGSGSSGDIMIYEYQCRLLR